MKFNLSEKAYRFFRNLAENYDWYPDFPARVVDKFIDDWETREHIPIEQRTFSSEELYDI